MIVRISGMGQFTLDDSGVQRLDELDTKLTASLHANDSDSFHAHLRDIVHFISSNGVPVPNDTVVPSDVIVPPEDVSLAEAHQFLSNEGLMEPLPA